MDVHHQTFSLRTCQKHTAAKCISSKSPSKLLFGTDMFTFDICLRFTHIHKKVNGQKINSNFKNTLTVNGKQDLDLEVNATFF